MLLPAILCAQSALLEIHVLGGDNAVYATGSRTQGLGVEVTDELGHPVSGAVVAVRLPNDGAGGSFANGLSSEIVTTGSTGRAVTSPVRWSWVAGAVEIKITAVKGALRAGAVTTCELSETIAAKGGPIPTVPAAHRKVPLKWVVIGLLAAGAATAGFASGRASGNGSGGGGTNPSNPTNPVQIGPPVISVGTP